MVEKNREFLQTMVGKYHEYLQTMVVEKYREFLQTTNDFKITLFIYFQIFLFYDYSYHRVAEYISYFCYYFSC